METIPTKKVNLKIEDQRFGKQEFREKLFCNKFFNRFRKEYPQYKRQTNIQIGQAWKKIAHAMISIVLKEPDGIKLDNNMGDVKLSLYKHKDKKLGNKDIRSSIDEDKYIKHMNFETNRKPGKLVWKTEYARVVHFYLRYLGFTPERSIKERCKEAFKEDGNIYKDISDKHKLIK